ncbi:MAG: 50S ribosomal protein L23 [Deltaproteobacteria bacterium]|nr:50S ribosomal protein L23 [Deltaproteobacteria bacterium]
MDMWNVIKGRKVTEKTTIDREENKYVFIVHKKATKIEVKRAVEKIFGVQAKKVNVMNIKGKKKLFKNKWGKRPNIRKAVVLLKQGQQIKDL